MKKKTEQSGLTLTETIVVVSIVAVFTVLGIPAIRAFFHSIESVGGARAMISASLSSARAIAAREQHYAGIRFQHRYQPDGKSCQYMIFIVQDPNIMAYGFRAVKGIEPIKLPDSVGVMDLRFRPDLIVPSGDGIINSDIEIDNDNLVRDTTTFSVIFSPSGKLVIHQVQVRNRDGISDTVTNLLSSSSDDIFNKKGDVDLATPQLIAMGMGKETGMFYQDDYYGVLNTPAYPDVGPNPNLGLGPELSRKRFIIYDRTIFEKLAPNRRYSDYLQDLATKEVVYINPYTGTMINK